MIKLSEIIKDTNKVKSRIGFDSENNMIVTEEPNLLAGQGFELYELNSERYNKLIDILKNKNEENLDGLDMLFELIPLVTNIDVDMTNEQFQIGVAMGNVTTYEFINLIAQAYKDIDKFKKLHEDMDKTINGVNKLSKEIEGNVGGFKK